MKYIGIFLAFVGALGCFRLLKKGKGKTFEERANDVWMWASGVSLVLSGLLMAVFSD